MHRFFFVAVIVVPSLLAACNGGGESAADGMDAAVAVGDVVTVARWDVQVVAGRFGGSPDANSPRERVDVRLTAVFSGEGTTTFADDVAVSARGTSGAAYGTSSIACSDALAIGRSIGSDEMVEGFVCFTVEMADSAGLQLLLTPFRGGAPVVLETVAQPEEGAEDFGPEEVVALLAKEGVAARLMPSPYARSSFLTRSASEQVLCLDGQEAQLHEYATAMLRQDDSGRILPSGQFESGVVDLQYGRLMWWAKGRVIVNYNFADPDVWDSLTAALGETVSPNGERFSPAPDPLPPSDLCS